MAVMTETEGGVLTALAPRYRVICHDDPVTTMEFVIHVLMRVFKKDVNEATELMLEVHKTGAATVAVMPLEEAEFRVEQAHALAKTAKYPLKFTYEPE